MIQFISDESRITELNFDDEFILFSSSIENSIKNSFAVRISTFFFNNVSIIDRHIFTHFFRSVFFSHSRLNQILARHFELQQRNLFFDFFDYIAFMIDAIDYFKVRELKIYKKIMRDFFYKMK